MTKVDLWYQVMEANLNGEMNLKIETDLVSVTTHFKELGNPTWGKNQMLQNHFGGLTSHGVCAVTICQVLRKETLG